MKNMPKPELPAGAPGTDNKPMNGGSTGMKASGEKGMKTIWIKKDSMIFPVPVETGMDDDLKTEIIKGLKPGEEIVLDLSQETAASAKKAPARNPFMPGPPSGTRR
jgi:hypothetical protein